MYTDLIRNRAGLAALLLALTLPLAPLAQTADPGAEDLRALIYYLDHNDQRSVQAEVRRLRAQFPGWTPPTDLNALRAQARPASAGVDVAPIWARIERGDHAGARRLIDQSRAAAPGWSPDAEMLRVLELAEGQAAFDAAHAAGNAAEAIAAARRTPALMRCDRINNAWRLADMYRASGQPAVAVETYRGVLSTCTRQADVLATLEKAGEFAGASDIEQLFAIARRTAPANRAALDALEPRLRAGQGGRPATAAEPVTAAPRGPVAAATTVAAAPAAIAPPSGTSSLPLRGDARIGEVRGLKEAGQWARCLAASNAPRSIEVLYERSWCAFNLDRAGEALAGFAATERAGAALGGEVNRDARFGMILSYLVMNMTETAAQISATTNLTERQRREVETTILDQRGVRAYLQRDYAGAITYFDALERLAGTLRRDLAMMRGYAYLNTNRTPEAEAEFTRLHAQLATDETRAALRAAEARRGAE